MAKKLRTFYPPIEPYDHGMLAVGDGHRVYWECCGNPKGKPVLFLHGGPGGGCIAHHRRLFNPKKYRIILFDQRGCGRSKPLHSLHANTTQHLIADIEKLRVLLGVESWLVFGGSWGSTLALAYAETHTKRVRGLILRGIFTGRRKELDWLYQEGASFLFPEAWQRYIAPLTTRERKDMMTSFRRRMLSKDKRTRFEAALAWSRWEGETSRLIPGDTAYLDNPATMLAIALIENHYFVNGCFVKEGQLIRDAKKLAKIPGVIIQGRYDVVCPPVTAFDLHKAWPGSELVIIPDAGHAYNEPGILDASIEATDLFAKY